MNEIKSYGVPGQSAETRTALDQGAPYVLMKTDRPEPHYVATESGEWVEPSEPVPAETPRYCAVMALKRHRLIDSELQELADEEGDVLDSLHVQVLAIYEDMQPSKARDDLWVALTAVNHWLRASPTVEAIRVALAMTPPQVDALFLWAQAYEASI